MAEFNVPMPLPQTEQPFENPYTQLRAALLAKQRALESAPVPPMFNPEEAAARKGALDKDRMMGDLGMLSRDPAIGGVEKPMLAEAIRASQKKQTDHGEFDPVTGEFREFPSYTRQRQVTQLDKELAHAGDKEAATQTKWEDQRQRAFEQWQRDRQSASERWDRDRQSAADRHALGTTLKAMGQAMASQPGSFSYAGVDESDGQPVMIHSKEGPVKVQPDGKFIRYTKPISQKPAGLTSGERDDSGTAVNNIGLLNEIITNVKAIEKNPSWRTRASTGILPGALATSGRGGQAIIEQIAPKELNDARQRLAYVVGEVRANRFGLTLTPSEAADSVQYLPSQFDDITRIREKAEGLERMLSKAYNTWRETRTRPGFNTPGLPNPGSAGGGGTPTPTPTKPKREFVVEPE